MWILRILSVIFSLQKSITLVGMAHDEASFQDNIRHHLPEIALLDLGLSRPDSGADLITWLAREYPVVFPVILTANESEILRCYQLGARGYMLKTRLETLGEVLRNVHSGQLIIPPDVGEFLVRQAMQQARQLAQTQTLSHVTEREKEILHLLKSGLGREAVALVAGGLAVGNLAARQSALVPLLWLHALLPGLIAGWVLLAPQFAAAGAAASDRVTAG